MTRPLAKRAPRARAQNLTSQGRTALAPDGLYRARQFLGSFIGLGKTRWYEGVQKGEFPQPAVKLSARCVLWRGADLIATVERLSRSSA